MRVMSMNITYIDSCSKEENEKMMMRRRETILLVVKKAEKWYSTSNELNVIAQDYFLFGYCSKPTFMFVLLFSSVLFLCFFFFIIISKSDTLEMKGKILVNFSFLVLFKENKSKSGCILYMRTKVYLFFLLLFFSSVSISLWSFLMFFHRREYTDESLSLSVILLVNVAEGKIKERWRKSKEERRSSFSSACVCQCSIWKNHLHLIVIFFIFIFSFVLVRVRASFVIDIYFKWK